MTRRPLLLLVAAATVALVGIALLHSGATEDAPAAAEPARESATEVPAATTVPVESLSAVISERLAAFADQPALPAGAVWLDVLVVDATTREPVADADVLWTCDDDWQRARAQAPDEIGAFVRDAELFAQRFGRRTRSDAMGQTKIGAPPSGAHVSARAGNRYGLAKVGGRPRQAEGWRVTLEVDCTLRAMVIDAAGVPAIGVPIAIRGCDAEGKHRLGSGPGPDMVTPAPDGIAEFRHAQWWLRRGGISGQRDTNPVRWIVSAQVPGHDDPGVAFDRDDPPQELIVLQLPATGRLLARLLHARQPVVESVQFAVFRDTGARGEAQNSATRVPPDADGWAHFPHVALGGMLRVRARIDNTIVETTTAAPGLPDQEVRIDLSTEAMVALCGRFVGPDGAPLVNTTVNAGYSVAQRMGTVQLQTDAQGRFRWFVGEPRAQPASLQNFVASYTASDGTPLRGDVAARPVAAGENDLGDVRLLAGPLVVAGRFLFDGVARPATAMPPFTFGIESLADRPGKAGEERWDIVHGLAQILRPDGTFALHGVARPVRHRLCVISQDYLPFVPVEFRPGTADLIAEFASGHALLAVCAVPDGVPSRLFSGALRRTGASKGTDGRDRWPAWPSRVDAGPLELRWAAVPPGVYALDVCATGHDRPLATIDDVLVPLPSGGDPRLHAIDLLAEVAPLRLHVRPGGPPAALSFLGPTLVFVLPQSNDRLWQAIELQGDEVVLPVPRGPIDLLVLRSGYQPCRMPNAVRQVTAALQPWPTAELHFADLPPLPDGARLEVELSPLDPAPVDDRGFHSENCRGSLSAWMQPFRGRVEVRDDRATVAVGDGALRIQVLLYPRAGAPACVLTRIEPVQLVGGPGVPPFVVRVTADQVRAAITPSGKTGK